MSAVEQEIIEKVRKLDADAQKRVLAFIEHLDKPTEEMPHKRLSALELWELPFEERRRIAIEALERSQNEDVELFEAYSEEDFDDE